MADIGIREQKLLEQIIIYLEKEGHCPSMKELADLVGMKSSSTVHYHLNKLYIKGYIYKEEGKPRTLKVLKRPNGEPYDDAKHMDLKDMVQLPVFATDEVGAEIFSETVKHERIAFSGSLLNAVSGFALKVHDTNLISIGIFYGDYLIVASQTEAKQGDLVVILFGHRILCARYFHERGQVRLEVYNENQTVLYGENSMIVGKVMGVYRSLQKNEVER